MIGEYSCKIVDGQGVGGIITGSSVWEWDGAKANLLSGYGVTRGPDFTDVFHAVDGKAELIMSEGKPTGWTSSGTAVLNLATGSAASSKGRTVSDREEHWPPRISVQYYDQVGGSSIILVL